MDIRRLICAVSKALGHSRHLRWRNTVDDYIKAGFSVADAHANAKLTPHDIARINKRNWRRAWSGIQRNHMINHDTFVAIREFASRRNLSIFDMSSSVLYIEGVIPFVLAHDHAWSHDDHKKFTYREPIPSLVAMVAKSSYKIHELYMYIMSTSATVQELRSCGFVVDDEMFIRFRQCRPQHVPPRAFVDFYYTTGPDKAINLLQPLKASLQYLSFSDACYVREKYGDLVAPIEAPEEFWDINECNDVSADVIVIRRNIRKWSTTDVVAWIAGDDDRISLWNTESARIYDHTIEQLAHSGADQWQQKMDIPGGLRYHTGIE